jgi:hypothetical protein
VFILAGFRAEAARVKLVIAVGDARPRNTENSFFFDLHRAILATLERSAG